MQRPALVAQEDAQEPQPENQEAQRERESAPDPPAPTDVAAVTCQDLYAEQRHAGGPAVQAPEMGEVDEPPDQIRNDHPEAAPVKSDVLAGHDAAGEIDGGKNQHEDPGEYDQVHHERGEPRRETRVVPLQALPGDSRGRGGHAPARPRGHDAAVARSPAGGPGGPV